VVAPVSRDGQAEEGFILILEDISERKRQAEWASAVQREMLPTVPPPLVGYELAGRCLAAQEVAGDLYDWVDTGDGYLELTVADVMGKGMGAALVMAALRAALRAAPGELGPAERVARAAASMTLGAESEGMFVTLFHGRLELATGRLRYVDAGHGYCLIRRAGGEIERLSQRSLPVGVDMGQKFKEGEALLEPGDLLLVCSDGLAEVDEKPAAVEELAVGLEPTMAAAETVERLLHWVSGPPADDVTVLILRRLATSQPLAAAPPRSGARSGKEPAVIS
jgi:serine phosphatase RsbU (regulator of sigma subunit)